jgi:hypothetical protein
MLFLVRWNFNWDMREEYGIQESKVNGAGEQLKKSTASRYR